MPGITLSVPSNVLPDTPPPKNSAPFVDVKPARTLAPSKSHTEVDFAFSLSRGVSPPPVSDSQPSAPDHVIPPSTIKVSTNIEDADDDTEEHTLSAYGDLSLSEDLMGPSPPISAIQKKGPRPRLRLKVRRPPMPKRRLSYVHAGGGTTPVSGELVGAPWPGSPSPICPHTPLHQHQPLISPLSAEIQSPGKSGSNSDSSIEKLVNGLMPRLPSIRFPVGKSNAEGMVDRPPSPRSSYGPKVAQTTEQTKQMEPRGERGSGRGGGWRTRLPPRPPIPKWDL
ncbi:hypothetical protein F5I97DRAFT_225652 [Phlebopus sp. FC_14]|nr:hypothetical protein F5I97DRAFT_225652 [Phlebopus sp. FC_14]